MSNASQMVKVDAQKMRDEFDKRMIVPTEAAREIGIHEAYLSKTFSKGSCNCRVVMKLQQRFGIDPEAYVDPDQIWKVRKAIRFEKEMKEMEEMETQTDSAPEVRTEHNRSEPLPVHDYLEIAVKAFAQALTTVIHTAVMEALRKEREERKHDTY